MSSPEEENMQRTWKPTTAGILSIIAGAISLIMGLSVTLFSVATIDHGFGMWWPTMGIPRIWGLFGLPLILTGILAIVGGSFAIKRRMWGLALAGAIAALFPPPVI